MDETGLDKPKVDKTAVERNSSIDAQIVLGEHPFIEEHDDSSEVEGKSEYFN